MIKQYRYTTTYKEDGTGKIYKTEHINSNAYVHLKYIQNSSELEALTDTVAIDTNIEDFDIFVADLVHYEKEENTSVSKAYGRLYGVILTFLIDKKRSTREYQFISQELATLYNLPYRSWMEVKGDGNYLHMYICERNYFPAGTTINLTYSRDNYKNLKTGRLCKKDDENAVLVNKKGDVYRQITSKFGTKTRMFHFSCPREFNHFTEKVKIAFVNILRSLGAEIMEGCTLPKFSYEKIHSRSVQKQYKLRQTAKVYNEYISKLEDEFDDVYSGFCAMKMLDEQSKKKFDQLFLRYKNIACHKHFSFNFGNKKLKYDLLLQEINAKTGAVKRVMSVTKALSICEVLYEKFRNDIQSFLVEFGLAF